MLDSTSLGVSVVSRREFLQTAVSIGGLALSIELPAQEATGSAGGLQPGHPEAPPRSPIAFVQVGSDDVITIVTPAVEMGQGGRTAMPMIIMEELGGDWQKLRAVDAPAAAIYNNPMFGQQSTVGSFSVRGWYRELRRFVAASQVDFHPGNRSAPSWH